MLSHQPPNTTEQPATDTAEALRRLAQFANEAPPTAAQWNHWPQFLNTREVAVVLRVSPATVRRLHRSGRLRAHSDFPTKLLFRVRDVEAFLRG